MAILERGLYAHGGANSGSRPFGRFSRTDQRRVHGLANAGYHCRYPKGDAAIPLAVLPPPANFSDLCRGSGRFGAHNINLNHMPEMSRVLKNTVVTAQFAGGLRIYSIEDPQEPKEIAYFAPNVPGNKGGAIERLDCRQGRSDLRQRSVYGRSLYPQVYWKVSVELNASC